MVEKIGPPQKKLIGIVDQDRVVTFDPGFIKDVGVHQGVNVPPLNPMPFDKVQEIGKGKTYPEFIKALVQAQAANPSNVWENGRSKADYWQFRVTPEELKGLTPDEVEIIKLKAKQQMTALAAEAMYNIVGGTTFGLGVVAAVLGGLCYGVPDLRAKAVFGGAAVAVASVDAYLTARAFIQITSARDAAIRDYVVKVRP